MSHTPVKSVAAQSLVGNVTAGDALPEDVAVEDTLELGDTLEVTLPAGRTTSGNATVQASDFRGIITSTSDSPVTLTVPAGLEPGFVFESQQGGDGQITYVAGIGATLVNTDTPVSGGKYIDNFYARGEHLGGDEWIFTGRLG